MGSGASFEYGKYRKAASMAPKIADNKKWIKDDACAMFLLTSTMDYTQVTLIENCKSSKEILIKLDAIYEQKTEINKMLAHEKFSQYKMDRSEQFNRAAYRKSWESRTMDKRFRWSG